MRDHEGQVGEAGDGAGQEQVRHGARRLEEELEHRRRVGGRERGRGRGAGAGAAVAGVVARGAGRRRVDEDGGAAPVQLREDGVERGRAEVVAVVVGEEAEAVGAVGGGGLDLGERGAHVGERQRGPEAELGRVAPLQRGGVGVAGAGQRGGGGVVAADEVGARRADGEDGAGDVEGAHEIEVGFFAPLLAVS